MDVVKENFAGQLRAIAGAIASCDFVAIDTELTGLSASKKARINALDSVEERYGKLRESASKFMTIQWGLCTFTKTSDGGYAARPFNFYVFPKPFHPNLDYTFVSSVSSLHFLASNNFDFNKLIYHGIPWLRRDEEERIKSSRGSAGGTAGAGGGAPKDDITLNETDKTFVDVLCAQIDEWLKTAEKELRLNPCNSFQRRITYQEIAKRYNNALYASTQGDEGSRLRYIVLSRLSEEEKKAKEQGRAQQIDAELEAAVGFRKVIDLLVESKKPLVGHNLLLDLVHTFSFLYPPPSTSQQFKSQIHALFPTIVDTKFVVSNSPELVDKCASTSLGDTYAAFNGAPYQNLPLISSPEGFRAYEEDQSRFHEAGFDAYITGVAYLRMAFHLAKERVRSAEDLMPTGAVMEEYANKLFLLRSDIPYLHLLGPDPAPDRTGVYYVHGFHPSLRTGDIVRHFNPFGKVFINWVDDSSLFVTLADKSHAPHVMTHFEETDPRPPFQVTDHASYEEWRSGSGSAGREPAPFPCSPAPLHPYASAPLSSPYSPRPSSSSSAYEKVAVTSTSGPSTTATTGKRKRPEATPEEELEEGEIRDDAQGLLDGDLAQDPQQREGKRRRQGDVEGGEEVAQPLEEEADRRCLLQ